MNNDQFRRLVQERSASSNTTSRGGPSSTPRNKDAAATSSVLGSRMRSSIPMTPRSVINSSGIDFARQLREANAPPPKRFKSSAAPKGTKLANGYVDRTQLRSSAEEDEKASRIKALEEMVKLGQMEYSTFEKLRDEIVGGEVENVHLVKGLDRRLLERARRGEDVYKEPERKAEDKIEEHEERMAEAEVDAALDDLEGREVAPIVREKKKEDTQSAMDTKRTRNDILKALKASRAQAQALAAPALGNKFRKLGARLEPGTSRIEIDDKGREVLVTAGEDGNVKRKVRKKKPAPESPAREVDKNGLLMPDKDAIPLGSDAPIVPQKPTPAAEPSDDEDIFEGVGADYDPLAGGSGSNSDSDSSDSESGEEKETSPNQDPNPKSKSSTSPQPTTQNDKKIMPPPPLPSKPRNYFASTTTASSSEADAVTNPLKDPTFLAALQKANSITRTAPDKDDSGSDAESQLEAARKAARRKEMLATHDRDAEDMDMGFGGSRFEDQEEGEEREVKLSKWEGDDDDGERGGQKQRKRGKKKKKEDKNSASDVLAVLEKRGRG